MRGNVTCKPNLLKGIICSLGWRGHGAKSHMDILGIIDTGADNGALPPSLAVLTERDLRSGASREIIMSYPVSAAYSHSCRIDDFDTTALLHKQPKFLYTRSDTSLDVTPNLHSRLQKVDNFLDRVILYIDYPRLALSIRKPGQGTFGMSYSPCLCRARTRLFVFEGKPCV